MIDRETTRLIAWGDELRRVHSLLRAALAAARAAAQDSDRSRPAAGRDLLVHCRGFCSALGAHHRGEDRSLFPAIEVARPELAPVLRRLEQDHSMIEALLTALAEALDGDLGPAELARHLDGVGAIMESHFAYEERQLLGVLDALELRADPRAALGLTSLTGQDP